MSGRKLLKPIKLERKEPSGQLWDIYKDEPLSGKWWHYIEIYQELLEDLRDRPIKLLEIGVYRGGSMRMWKKYLHPDSIVVGIDAVDNVEIELGNGIHFREGDQADKDFLAGVVAEFGPFDVIVDDGSHISSDQTDSFIALFGDGLKEGGLYIVEDTHTSYWEDYVKRKRSFIDTCIQLIHLIHAVYFNAPSPRFFAEEVEERDPVDFYEAWIHSIQFFDSIVVFEKRLRGYQVADLVVFNE